MMSRGFAVCGSSAYRQRMPTTFLPRLPRSAATTLRRLIEGLDQGEEPKASSHFARY
jgi:hypothetical protein